ncbi:MAG: hypothetical protein ACQXXD_06370 [Thermoplasmatota archaeon]
MSANFEDSSFTLISNPIYKDLKTSNIREKKIMLSSLFGFDLEANEVYLSSQPADYDKEHVVTDPQAGDELYIHWVYTIWGYGTVDPFYWRIWLYVQGGGDVIDYEYHVTDPELRQAGYIYKWCFGQPWVAPGGDYTLTLEVDSHNDIDEDDEDNNIIEEEFTVTGSGLGDLIAQDIWMSSQPNDWNKEYVVPVPDEGDEVWFHFEYDWIGSDTCPTHHIEISLDDSIYCEGDVSGVPGGYTVKICCTSSWAATSGDHVLTGETDTNDNVSEWNESNNVIDYEFTVEENYPPVFSNENPANGSMDVSITLSELTVTIEDLEGDSFDWTIETSPDIGSSSGTGAGNGTKTCPVSGLEYNTTYTWYVNATDTGSGETTEEVYMFTTEKENNPPYKPSEPNPENGKPDVNLTPILSVLVIDPDGNTMDVSFYGKEVSDTDHDTYKYIGTDTGVPSGGRAQITWPGLDYDTTYKWYAIADDGKESNTSDRWSFTTRAQYIPDPPTDFIATTINRTCINLSWTNAGDNKTYIEWNTIEIWNRGEGTSLYNGTDTSYSHTNLSFNTQYFYQAWSYNETDNIYSLTYASDNATTDANQPPYMPSDPNPENGTTGVDKNADLSWTGGDPDNDTVTYDVYFGNTSSPPKVESNQSTTTYEPGTLEFNTTYYWKIVAWDNYNESNASSIWSFTTEKPPNKSPKVKIIKPKRAVYINNEEVLPRLIRMTLIIGDITIEVNATDEDSGIEKVEFIIKSIDGEVKNTSYERNEDGLYSYTWTRDRIRLIHIHIIKVVAYDKDGATAKQQMIVRRYL